MLDPDRLPAMPKSLFMSEKDGFTILVSFEEANGQHESKYCIDLHVK